PTGTFRARRLEVKVRAASPAGFTGVAKQIPFFDLIARGDHHTFQVQVLRFKTVRVRDDDVVCRGGEGWIASARGTVTAGEADSAVTSGDDWNSGRHAEVPGPGVVHQVTSGVVRLRYGKRSTAPKWRGELGQGIRLHRCPRCLRQAGKRAC